jgi:hypothetical protein
MNGGRCLSYGSESRREDEMKTRSERPRQKLAKSQISCPRQIPEAQGGMEETSYSSREGWNLIERETY